jgi:hypothetical protein
MRRVLYDTNVVLDVLRARELAPIPDEHGHPTRGPRRSRSRRGVG